MTRLAPETQVALRASLAAALAMIVSHLTPMQRWYWAVMVAVLLVNGTWGENVRKAAQRLGMTALGCLAAWGLDLLTRRHENGQIAVMLIAIFLAAYFRTGSYAWMTFFVSVYVIFLFALFGEKPANIVRVRVAQTAIGIAVAFVASLIVPTSRAGSKWQDQLAKFWESAAESFDAVFAGLLDGDRSSVLPTLGPAAVIQQLDSLRTQHRASLYEGWFIRGSRDRSDLFMQNTRMLGHDLLALIEAAKHLKPAVVQAFRSELQSLRDCTMSHFHAVRPPSFQQKGAEECEDGLDAIERRWSEHAVALVKDGHLPREELILITPFITYVEHINRVINEVAVHSEP